MNQRVAKRLKKEVYGDYEPIFTCTYYKMPSTGMMQRDNLRQAYQQAKKQYIQRRQIR